MAQLEYGLKGAVSLYEEQLKRGFGSLRFDAFLEDEFRTTYRIANFMKSRLVIALALLIVSLLSVMHALSGPVESHPPSVANFGIAIMIAALLVTIGVSYMRSARLYPTCLAFCALAIGFAGTLIDVEASAIGQGYYFGGQIGWILIIWMMFGFLFVPAAVLAATVSIVYVLAAVLVGLQPAEIYFETFMLVNLNLLGGYSCYKIEYGARKTFLESNILAQHAERDGLTGLHNRRAFDEFIERIWRQSRREREQLTVMLIDIDNFKAFNDLYGHQAGDDALRQVANVIADSIQRPLDFAARFGGEEFALVLYGSATDYRGQMPEKLRETIRDLGIEHEQGADTEVLTVSIGVAVSDPDTNRSLAGVIQMADEALYQAKEGGRNRVVVHKTATTPIETGKFRARARAAG
jgi:diguanylate cyclase (GGDEF)-like protein